MTPKTDEERAEAYVKNKWWSSDEQQMAMHIYKAALKEGRSLGYAQAIEDVLMLGNSSDDPEGGTMRFVFTSDIEKLKEKAG